MHSTSRWINLRLENMERKNRASRTRKRKYYGRKCDATSEGDIPEAVLTQEALTEEESVEII